MKARKTHSHPDLGLRTASHPRQSSVVGTESSSTRQKAARSTTPADIYPYSIRNSLNPSTNPTAPKLTNNMFPAYSTLGPFPVSTLTFIAVIESDNPLNPYVQSWTAGVQRELVRNTTLEVNYIGTHAIHLLDRRQIAQPNGIPSDSLAFCQQQVNGKYVNLNVAPCSNASRRPYQNFVEHLHQQ